MSRTSASRAMHALAGLLDQAHGLGEVVGGRGGDAVGLDLRADVGDDDVGALLGQPDGMRAALPSRSAGDEGHPAR